MRAWLCEPSGGCWLYSVAECTHPLYPVTAVGSLKQGTKEQMKERKLTGMGGWHIHIVSLQYVCQTFDVLDSSSTVLSIFS